MPTLIVRSMQTGFRHLWDNTGGDHSRAWFEQFIPQHYQFSQLQRAVAEQTNDIRVGQGPGSTRASSRVGKDASFRFEPRGLPTGSKEKKDEYIRKRLFSWALHFKGDNTAQMFNRELPMYESTKREGGPPKGAPELSPRKKRTKFFWGMLKSHRDEVDALGGHPWGSFVKDTEGGAARGMKIPRISPEANDFLSIYQKSILSELDWKFKPLADKALRDLLSMLGNMLTVHRGGRTALGAESGEELGLRILEELNTTWRSSLSPAENVARAIDRVAQAEGFRRGAIDIPGLDEAGNPQAAGAQSTVRQLMQNAQTHTQYSSRNYNQVLDDIWVRGLEVTSAPRRLEQMYEAGSGVSVPDYLDTMAETIQRDVFTVYGTPGGEGLRRVPGESPATVGEQFFRRISRQTGGGLVWSNPAHGGVAFFSIWIPPNMQSADQVAVLPLWLPITTNLWDNALNTLLRRSTVNEIRRAVNSAVDRGVTHTTLGYDLYMNSVGTDFIRLPTGIRTARGPGGPLGHLTTQVSVVPIDDVAQSIYDLVEASATAYGTILDVITVGGGGAFYQWVEQQHRVGEKGAQAVDKKVGTPWRPFVTQLGGKTPPLPRKSIGWPQAIHPRPYLSLTAAGRGGPRSGAWRDIVSRIGNVRIRGTQISNYDLD